MLRVVAACGLLFALAGQISADTTATSESLADWAKKAQGKWSYSVFMKGKKIGSQWRITRAALRDFIGH